MQLVQIYFKKYLQLLPVPISLHFFCFYLNKFPFWIWICILNADPDPGGKMFADPDPQPCWSDMLQSYRYPEGYRKRPLGVSYRKRFVS